MAKILITGGAGFIGSNVCQTLLKDQPFPVEHIAVVDNLSLGKKEFLREFIDNGQVTLYEQDLLHFDELLPIFEQHHPALVWHLAANSDIQYSAIHTDWDLKQGTLATYNVLECMRRCGAKKLIFSSSSAIYGETKVMPTPEDIGPLFPISYYGAAKLAGEGLVSAFCHNAGFQAWMFRFANIVGRNGTHGVIVDFIKKLRQDPAALAIFGDGEQAKPYLHVADCVAGMLFGYMRAADQVNYFNLGCPGATSVKDITQIVMRQLGLSNVKISYTGGARGWPGDVPQVRMDTQKMEQLGWRASGTSTEAVERATADLAAQII